MSRPNLTNPLIHVLYMPYTEKLKEQQVEDHEISSSTETRVVVGCQVPARSCAVQTNTSECLMFSCESC